MLFPPGPQAFEERERERKRIKETLLKSIHRGNIGANLNKTSSFNPSLSSVRETQKRGSCR